MRTESGSGTSVASNQPSSPSTTRRPAMQTTPQPAASTKEEAPLLLLRRRSAPQSGCGCDIAAESFCCHCSIKAQTTSICSSASPSPRHALSTAPLCYPCGCPTTRSFSTSTPARRPYRRATAQSHCSPFRSTRPSTQPTSQNSYAPSSFPPSARSPRANSNSASRWARRTPTTPASAITSGSPASPAPTSRAWTNPTRGASEQRQRGRATSGTTHTIARSGCATALFCHCAGRGQCSRWRSA
mmetsp:Transcript_45773/g.151760  ORF Transcript_45773/g.151760 Transcript_45773/m.151760 type:complete len:243 (+) Transcript_45773:272-1000(+)